MTDVVSIKFKNRGKCYFFSPNGLDVQAGDKVIVETSKGLEIADCCRGNHPVMDTAVVQPLRPVVRIATRDDLRVAQLNVQREKEAFEICQQKIAEHGLDMKLVDVECNFEGTKTMFFFTSDGRVDFRELVKDLAAIFRNRIELRQIGVRDEAKMIGGIGICGRPYCCSQFLDDFQPVSTKMAKVQSLSLNPAKISGSCGRLMCCLRYEQDAYEDLIKKVPKQGAFVETKDGFGTAVQVNLLRQTVKVKLDEDDDDSLRTYKPNELCAVPGGRPKDGEQPVSTFKYVPEPEEEETVPEFKWEPEPVEAQEKAETAERTEQPRPNRRRRQRKPRQDKETAEQRTETKVEVRAGAKPEPRTEAGSAKSGGKHHRGSHVKKTVKVEAKQHTAENAQPAKESGRQHKENPQPRKENAAHGEKESAQSTKEAAPRRNNHRRYYHGKPKQKGSAQSGGSQKQ